MPGVQGSVADVRSQKGKKEYNLVLIHPDDGSTESWTAEGSADKMRAEFADYEPR